MTMKQLHVLSILRALFLVLPITYTNAFCNQRNRQPFNYQHTQQHVQQSNHESSDRRTFLDKVVGGVVATTTAVTTSSSILLPSLSYAEEGQDVTTTFKRTNTKLNFGYEFVPPPSVIKTSNKPLQTHLDEINLPTSLKGYTYGVTVDPIRIKSLKEFGTPSEVAAKIVMAELRRDGVLDVTLASDAKEDNNTGAYDVEYISDGTRGKKHFVTRTIVKDGKLFVMTVQVKQDDWDGVQNEVFDAIQSFHILEKDAY